MSQDDTHSTQLEPSGKRPEQDVDERPTPGDASEHQDKKSLNIKSLFETIKTKPLFLFAMVALGFLLGALLFSSPDAPTEASPSTPEVNAETIWTCSMDPQVRATEPGPCPICGMDLIPASNLEGGGSDLGPDRIMLSPRARALARLVTTEVVPTVLEGSERQLSGQVVNDESSYRAVTTWIAGRIDKLYIDTTGARIKRGAAMARLYSPEIYAAHQDLIVARQQIERLADAAPYARQAAETQLEAATQKLRLLGFSRSELERMKTASKPWTQVTIRSASSGTVLSRKVYEGQYVKQGDILYEVSNLNNVWVELDAYESDLELLEEGQAVSLSLRAFPQKRYQGTVTFIDPVLDPRTRTASVRVEVPNEDGALKPGMFATATLEASITRPGEPLSLVIPRSAPLMAGDRAIVYVEQESDPEQGTIYVAREVVLGPRVKDQYIVKAGLARGERIVTQGAFVLDSEMQIRGKLGLMARPDDRSRASTPPEITLSKTDRDALQAVILGYLDLQELLASDSMQDSITRAKRWREQIESVQFQSNDNDLNQAWRVYSRLFLADLGPLIAAEDLSSAREQFSLLTQTMDRFLQQFGNISEQPIRLAYCPMAHDNRGDHWYQRARVVDNVYFGEQMRTCGEIRQTLSPGERLVDAQNTAGASAKKGGDGHVH